MGKLYLKVLIMMVKSVGNLVQGLSKEEGEKRSRKCRICFIKIEGGARRLFWMEVGISSLKN